MLLPKILVLTFVEMKSRTQAKPQLHRVRPSRLRLVGHSRRQQSRASTAPLNIRQLASSPQSGRSSALSPVKNAHR